MRIREHRCRTELSSGLAIAALALLMATATACGGSATTATSGASTPQATPSLATPERLVGSDPVAVTQRAVDLARAALHATTVAKLVRPYARDVVVDDFTYDMHSKGRAAVVGAFRGNLREYSGAHWVAGYAGRGWAVIEERWDFTKTYKAMIELVAVQETRGGKVVYEGDYYQNWDNLPKGQPLEPKALTSAPGSADTAPAAEAVALKYAMALQAKDAAAVAALSAPTIAFMDTASSTVGDSPDQVQERYAKIFEGGLPDLIFTHLRYAFGRGWAAVIWTASSLGAGGGGVTVLEIRDGRIARETLYYTSSSMPF